MFVHSTHAKVCNLSFKGDVGVADELPSYNDHPVKIVTDKLTEKDRVEIKRALEQQSGYIDCLAKTDYDVGFSHQTAAMYRPGEIETLYWGRADGEGIDTFVRKALKFFTSRAHTDNKSEKDKDSNKQNQWLA